MNELSWGAIGAALGAFVAGLWTWLTQRGRSRTEIEIAALAEWKEISKGWADRLEAVERDFAAYRTKMAEDIEELRRDHAAELEKIRRDHADELDEIRRHHRTEMKKLRDHAEGLERQIAQNSQSTAHLMGDSPVTKPKNDGK